MITISRTYAEIKSQFSALKETLVYVQNRMNIINRFLGEKSYDTVAFVGSGSSYLISKSLENIYRNSVRPRGYEHCGGGFMATRAEVQKPLENAVVIAISRSGGTGDLSKR